MSDNNLQMPDLDCIVTKKTLRDYIIGLKNMYNQLLDDESEAKTK